VGVPLTKGSMLRPCIATGYIWLFVVFPFQGAAQQDSSIGEDSMRVGVASTRVVRDISIAVHTYPGNPSRLKTMARDLIFLREGEPYSVQKLVSTISAFEECKKFKSIHIDSTGDAQSISFSFTLEPFLFIRKINVTGYFPLFESEILKVMSVRTGSAYSEEVLEKQKVFIEELYAREGFIDAQVQIAAQEYSGGEYVDLHVTITKGLPLVLHTIKLEGNSAFSRLLIKLRMTTFRKRLIPFSSRRFVDPFSSRRFVEKNIADDIKQLTTFYRKGRARKRFPECVITPHYEIDSTQKRVTVLLSVSEGPRYTMQYRKSDGNRLKRRVKRKLRKELIIFEKGNRNDLGLKKSVQNMKKQYKRKGYINTHISLSDTIRTRRRNTERRVTFSVDEGPRSVVSTLEMKGNNYFTLKKIKKQLLTREQKPFIEETFEKDLLAIETLYRNFGYQNAIVSQTLSFSDDKSIVATAVDIREGKQTIITDMGVDSLFALPESKARKVIRAKIGDPLQRGLIKNDRIALSALVAEEGYPYVKIRSETTMNSDSSQARIVYRVQEGPKVCMGNVYYSGNFKTKKWVMKREIDIESGQPFSLKEMLEGQKELRNLNIFNSVAYKTVGLKEREDTVHLFIELEEKKPYFIQTGIGYESDIFWGRVKGGDHNFLGLDKDVSIGARITHLLGYRFDLGLVQSRLFGFRTKNITEIYVERILEQEHNFGVMAYGASLGITRRLFSHVTSTAGFIFERRDQFKTGTTSITIPSEEFKPRNLITISPSLTYDKRDSFTRPKKGVFTTVSIALSKGVANSLDDFIQYEYDLRLYRTFLRRFTFATIGRVGYIDPLGNTDTIPRDQLFFLGGTRDVRGFRENELKIDEIGNPVGGRAVLSASVEARIDLGLNFELPVFCDIGRIDDHFRIASREEFRSSAGFGLRYITPIGPIGFLYGFKVKQSKDEDLGKFHFSLGYTF